MTSSSSSSSSTTHKLSSPTTPSVRDFLFKFLIIGDYGVGKTAIVRRYSEGNFSPTYKVTIGADFNIKSMMYDEHTKVTIQLWDIAGHERFGHSTRIYYKYAVAAAIVFDITRVGTFDSIKKWLVDLREKVTLSDGTPIPVILLANKWDAKGSLGDLNESQIVKLCNLLNITAWFPTSAKEGLNIDEAFKCMIDTAVKYKLKEDASEKYDHGAFNLGDNSTNNVSNSNRTHKCCY